jgi:ribosomal protein L25 (general stress protein Ctc)
VLPNMPTGTDTMHFIAHADLPADRTATYLRIVSAEKPNKKESKRIRFTGGGDRVVYDGNVSTPTADIISVKCLFNSVISTPDARFMSIDIKDFYLNKSRVRLLKCALHGVG